MQNATKSPLTKIELCASVHVYVRICTFNKSKRKPVLKLQMDPATKMAFARRAKETRRVRRETATLRRTRGQILQRLAASAPATPRAYQLRNEARQIEAELTERNRRDYMANMIANFSVAPSRRRYSEAFLRMAFTIAMTSLPCYFLLRRFLVFPTYTTLMTHFGDLLRQERGFITNTNQLPMMLAEWSQSNEQEKTRISELGGFLAVDAISLHPHVVITRDGLIEGVITDRHNISSDIGEFQLSYARYEEFVKSIENKTVTDSFVYHYQPVAADVPCRTIFVEPSTQGKATAREIDRLGSLADILDESGFPVRGFAFDGDSTYRKLHNMFFSSYCQIAINNVSFSEFTVPGRVMVSDPLHLLKRARYRLLSATVHSGMENTTDSVISVDKIRQQLDLPSQVFATDKFTKMHDDLATKLFSLDTLASLFQMRNLTALAYFLPLCLLTSALEEEGFQVKEREFLLEIGFYYMLSYNEICSDCYGHLRTTKSKNETDIKLFDIAFTREYCNTVFAILGVLKGSNGTVALNRVGTNPLEHLFGLVRMKSRSVHIYEKMLRVLSKVELAKKLMVGLGEGLKIDQRKSYFAQVVKCEPERRNENSGETRDIAFSLHCLLGMPITVRHLMVWDALTNFEIAMERFDNLRNIILELHRRVRGEPHRVVSSREIKTTTGRQILGRLVDRFLFPKQ